MSYDSRIHFPPIVPGLYSTYPQPLSKRRKPAEIINLVEDEENPLKKLKSTILDTSKKTEMQELLEKHVFKKIFNPQFIELEDIAGIAKNLKKINGIIVRILN